MCELCKRGILLVKPATVTLYDKNLRPTGVLKLSPTFLGKLKGTKLPHK